MHVSSGWWDSIRLKLDKRELGLTSKESLARTLISLELHTDEPIAGDVLVVTATEMVDAFIFDHTKSDGPVDVLPHFISAQIYPLTVISRCIEGSYACA